MNASQWAKVKEILDTALDLPADTRASYLSETCGNDPEIYLEVKSLLDSSDRAGAFLESSYSSPSSALCTPQAPGFSRGQLVADRFQIVRFIAHGGMGEVYEAVDLSLYQNIALKLVRPDMLSEQTIARFKQEVACARRITHPNVCRVFDLEQCVCGESGKEVFFLTMEFLEGETLRNKLNRQGRMTVTEALPIICQIAKALAASHAVGVIHRDLKPSNVILSPDALDSVPRAVVTDFGVARASDQGGAENAYSKALTNHGQMVGTTLYMAPEQAEGNNVSPATDIYALGLIMYEMLAGRKPFSEKSPFTGLIERTKNPPVSPRIYAREVGSYLESLILSCLEVKPADRIQDATVLVNAIERLMSDPSCGAETPAVSSPPVSQLSLAVLPFINLSRDPENEYFSDGLTEELMGALAKVEGLRVVSRNSSFRYRRAAAEFQEIARQLKVSAILIGTVRHNRDRLRVTVKLIDAALGWNIWAEHYDRRMEDIFAVQEEIANAIACELEMKLRTETPSGWTTRRTKSSDAYDCFLKGLYFSKKRTSSNLERAAENFRQAIALDPKFASAHAALANCFAAQGVYGNQPPNQVFPLAKQHLDEALKIDSKLSAAHCTSGIVQMFLEHDLGSAERSFQRAVELDSNYALARQWYGAPCLMVQGRFREARAQLQLAHELDPLSLLIRATLGSELYFERRYDDALRELNAVLEMDPAFGLAYYALGPVYEKKEMYPEAITALKRAVELTEGSAPPLALLGRAYALAGHASEARAHLVDLERLAATRYVSPVCFAYVFSGLDETSLALDCLERAFQWRTPEIIGIRVWPVFDSLHPEPRFQSLCKAIGI